MKKKIKFDIDKLIEGDRRTLAKAITMVENKNFIGSDSFFEIMQNAQPVEAVTLRLAVSGPPGAGKSTFINQLGKKIIQHQKVAILPIDPTSPFSGGSILGDKTRMIDLIKSENAFIRPSPSKLANGGITQTTREATYLCEMAGYDTTIIETVGVGQGEYHVRNQVDFFILVLPPASGDEIQAMKKGILEISDIIVFNKADGNLKALAENSASEYQNAFNYSGIIAPYVTSLSSLSEDSFDDLWKKIVSIAAERRQKGTFSKRREEQELIWYKELTSEFFSHQFLKLYESSEIKKITDKIKGGKIDALTAFQISVEKINALLNFH